MTENIMLTRRQAIEQIREAILAKQTEIKIDIAAGADLLKEVIAEKPELSIGIKRYSVSTSYSLSAHLSIIKLEYDSVDIPPQRRCEAQNDDDVSKILHLAMETYMPDLLIVAKSDLPIFDEIGSFFRYYDGFYSNLVSYDSYSSSFKEFGVSQAVITLKYRVGRVLLNIMEKRVDKEIEQLAKKLFCSGMSDCVKAYIAHNYIASTVSYHLNRNASGLELSHQQSAYGALIDHKCVCQGYAESYKRLLDAAGVFCDVVCGKIKGSLEYHAWNMIRLDGKNYHVDVTWDSRGGGIVSDEYFCLSDKEMQPKRLWSRRKNSICDSELQIADKARAEIKLNKAKYASLGIDTKYLIC